MMDAHAYQVAGWMLRSPLERPYWAQFGYYPTLAAAQRAAQAMAAAGCTISITLNSQTLATYQDGELVSTDPHEDGNA